jgi:tRNA(Phe) wybutosine-synthesizing methylase Tyw3
MKVVDKVKSPLLTKVLKRIVKKLLDAMQGKILVAMKKIGISTARKLSQIAQTCGHKTATRWKTDFNFVRYLVIMHINTSPLYITHEPPQR